MKKNILFVSILCVIAQLFLIAPTTHAEESKTTQDIAGTLPTSMWYWVDVVAEQMTLWRASDQERPEILRAMLEEKKAEMALTLGKANQAAQAGERYEIYFRDLAKTIDANNAEQYAQFVSYTMDQIASFTAVLNDAGQDEIPTYMVEISNTMSETHDWLVSALQGDTKTMATNALLSAVETFSNSAATQVAQEMITHFAQSIFQWISNFLQEQFTSLNSQVQQYVHAQAQNYLDQAKSSVIEYIQSIQLQ